MTAVRQEGEALDAPGALSWKGRRLPCAVRVAVYAAGQAAGLGLRAGDPAQMRRLLEDGELRADLPALIEGAVAGELARQGVTTGIDDEAVADAIAEFIGVLARGSGETVTRKVAAGQLPKSGEDARLEYLLQTDRVPLRLQSALQRQRSERQTRQVGAGQTLVVRHPPETGAAGVTVRGEAVPPRSSGRDQRLEVLAGPNTRVESERIAAAVEGIYREDGRGRVRVVQELEVEAVNAATGDLPHSGVAAVNLRIRRGVARGSSVRTTEDMLVGAPPDSGSLEGGSRVEAGNLIVRGVVSGAPLPPALLEGELEALSPEERRKVESDLDRSLIHVRQVFAAAEVTGRNVTAGLVLVQRGVRGAALACDGDLRVDGDLVGGCVQCGGCVSVVGDLGSPTGGAVTRIRLELESPEARRRRRLGEELVQLRAMAARRLQEVEAQRSQMEDKARRSQYWAALLKGEKRPPARPVERRLLAQFLQEARDRRRLEEALGDAQHDARGAELLLEELADVEEELSGRVRVQVGGTAHTDVRLELVRPLEASHLDMPVRDRRGEETTVGRLRNRLADQVDRYLELYERGVEERREALDRMFEGVEQRPEAPQVPDRRFQEPLLFPERGGPFATDGLLFVHAHEPTALFLRMGARLRARVRGAAIRVERVGEGLEFECEEGGAAPRSWQEDGDVLEQLEAIQVRGVSARQHLLE